MIIGIEAERANLPSPAGPERYASELIRHLAELDRHNQYVLYFRTKPQPWFYDLPDNFKIKIIPFPKFWTQVRISWEMVWHPVDVLMILASTLPLIHPKNSIVTVHDIAFEIFEGIYTGFMQWYQKFSARFAVRRARKLITVSEATKKDLIRIYHTDPHKIEAIPLGKDERLRPLSYDQVQPVLDKFGLTYKKYILFVGTLQPRKNIIRLIDAFIQLRQKHHIEEKLVLVGGKGWLWKPIVRKITAAGEKNAVYFLGYVTDEEKLALYNGATVETLPAWYEGFGFPPLEAMACGTPVVVSNISSLPEVVGEAGVLIDPNSVNSLAEGLLKVLTNPSLREKMRALGFEQAAKFTWQETARKTLTVIESLKI